MNFLIIRIDDLYMSSLDRSLLEYDKYSLIKDIKNEDILNTLVNAILIYDELNSILNDIHEMSLI